MGDVAPARNAVRKRLVNRRENGRRHASPRSGRKTVAHGASRGKIGPAPRPSPARGGRTRESSRVETFSFAPLGRTRSQRDAALAAEAARQLVTLASASGAEAAF